MIPKEIIKLAIKGGYEYQTYAYAEIALDPTFWKALGKAKGWEEEMPSKYDFNKDIPEHKHNAFALIDLILTRQDPAPFWDEILKDTKEV